MKIDKESKKLISILERLVNLLEPFDDHWTKYFRQDLEGLKKGNRRVVDHILEAYGCMGSFTDIAHDKNSSIGKLSNELYNTAKRLKESTWILKGF